MAAACANDRQRGGGLLEGSAGLDPARDRLAADRQPGRPRRRPGAAFGRADDDVRPDPHLLRHEPRRAAARACSAGSIRKYHTPHVVTIITGVFVALFAAFFPVGALADISNSGTLFAFAMVAIAVLVLRRTDPDRHRPFRTPAVIVVAPLAVHRLRLPVLQPVLVHADAVRGLGGVRPDRLLPYSRSHSHRRPRARRSARGRCRTSRRSRCRRCRARRRPAASRPSASEPAPPAGGRLLQCWRFLDRPDAFTAAECDAIVALALGRRSSRRRSTTARGDHVDPRQRQAERCYWPRATARRLDPRAARCAVRRGRPSASSSRSTRCSRTSSSSATALGGAFPGLAQRCRRVDRFDERRIFWSCGRAVRCRATMTAACSRSRRRGPAAHIAARRRAAVPLADDPPGDAGHRGVRHALSRGPAASR